MAYAKTTWTSGVTPISAANLNNLETQYDEAVGFIDGMTESAPTRALGTEYQNTSGHPMFVCVSVLAACTDADFGCAITARIGASSPGATDVAVAANSIVGTMDINVFFLVPPGYYYKIVKGESGGSLMKIYWHEWIW